MFPQLTPEERKVWYIDAVRGSLVINHGVTGKTADVAIGKYQLQDSLTVFRTFRCIMTPMMWLTR